MAARTYWSAIDETGSTTNSTTQTAKLTLTIATPPANKDILYLESVTVSSSTQSVRATIDVYDGSAVLSSGTEIWSHESHGTSPADIFGCLQMHRWQTGASPSSRAISLRYYVAGTAANCTFNKFNIIALQLETGDQYAESLGASTNATTSLSDKTTLTWDPGGTKDYLIIATCQLKLSASTQTTVAEKCVVTIDGVAYDETACVCQSANDYYSWTFVKKVTLATGSRTAKISFRSDGALTLTIRNARIVALALANFDASYYADNDTTGSTSSAGYSDHTSLSQTPAAGDHIIISDLINGVNNTSNYAYFKTLEGASILQPLNMAAKNVSETQAWAMGYATLRNLAASATTWKTQYAGNGTATGYLQYSSITGLQLFAGGGPPAPSDMASAGVATSSVVGASLAVGSGSVVGVGAAAATAILPIERLAPDAIVASTNLTGAVAGIQDDPDSPDGTWLTATSATAATDLRVSFGTPTGNPNGTQNFRYLIRKTTGTPNPTIVSELRQNNTLRKTFESGTEVSSTSGTVLEGDWNSSDLATVLDGSDVEFRIVSTPGTGASTPGALPAYSAAGTVDTSNTMPGSHVPNMPAHAVGDLLIGLVLCRNTNNNGVLTDVNDTANGGTTGWTLENNSGNMYGGTQNARIGFGWKIATSTSEVLAVQCTGGTSTDFYAGRVYKFTAANGFYTAEPIQKAWYTTEGTLSASVDMDMPFIETGGTNELALCIYGISTSSTVAAATGETGGDWTEPVAESSSTNGVIGIQIADLSGGGSLTGGTAATSATSGVWIALGMRLVPATISGGAVNTVEIGAVEWNCTYAPLAAGSVAQLAYYQYRNRWLH